MHKYKRATPKNLAEMLLRDGEVSFAVDCSVDGDIDGNADSKTNCPEIADANDWFGAKIVSQFNGTSLLVNSYGGGMWCGYDITS